MEWLSVFKREPIGWLTLVVTLLLHGHQSLQNSVSEERATLQARAAEIRLQGVDFQTYMGAYVSAVLDGEPVQEPLANLTENVMRQYAAVDLSKDVYDVETKALAEKYRESLTVFQGTLREVNGVTDMRPFWEAASDLLTVRDEFLSALNEQS